MANIDSPFHDMVSPKSTTPQAPTAGGVIGHDPILTSPAQSGDFKTVFDPNVPVSTGSFDSPYDMALVKSAHNVTGGRPSGTSTIEGTFKDALMKNIGG